MLIFLLSFTSNYVFLLGDVSFLYIVAWNRMRYSIVARPGLQYVYFLPFWYTDYFIQLMPKGEKYIFQEDAKSKLKPLRGVSIVTVVAVLVLVVILLTVLLVIRDNVRDETAGMTPIISNCYPDVTPFLKFQNRIYSPVLILTGKWFLGVKMWIQFV